MPNLLVVVFTVEVDNFDLFCVEPPFTEQDVEDRSVSLMRDCPSMALACFSGQNVDRFVKFFRASVRSGRTFVIDAYMANLIDALGLGSLPDPRTSARLRVYLMLERRNLSPERTQATSRGPWIASP